MAMSSLENDLVEALKRLRDYRAWAYFTKKDLWMTRQALVMTLELDTIALLAKGCDAVDLLLCDTKSRIEAKKFVKELRF